MTLKSEVGGLSLFALGVNGIVGVGIFFTPNLIAGLVPGARGASVFALTALLLLPVAVTFSSLGRALPIDGGPYVWARSAFGSRIAFMVGWVASVSSLLSTAAVIAGLRDNLAPAVGVPQNHAARALFVWLLVLILTGIASRGLRPSAWVWDSLTALKLLPLALLLLLGLTRWTPHAANVGAAPANFARALLVAVFPLQGFEIVPVLAGSARHGRVHVPLATTGSLLFAAALYAGLQLVCTNAVPNLAAQSSPLAATGFAVGGALGGRLVELGTQISALGVAVGMVVMTPRYIAALGNEAGLGAWLGREDAAGVPQAALWWSALIIASLASLQALGALFVLSSAAVLVQYVAALAALGRLSWRREFGLSRLAFAPALLGLGAVALLFRGVEAAELPLLAALAVAGALVALWPRRGSRAV